ncbi:general transcription factor 3C polypeptide 4-like isoform X2 [Mizuhopecten yessoensis]|uniref:general transcription factor 3C polypeptide 4-like isoform X2 n=1 Tax=Mizuhopecten yessoensis TaxID=6573 RepID=UPI000B45C905|nr:general transcription factor 3C polypeptide 4-like isoform X2 [Mizuhopecten yessoensis]
MAADGTEGCMYTFNLKPSCINAVKWSSDGRVAIAANECVLLMELDYSPHQLVSSSSCHIKSIPAWKEQHNMSGLDEVQFRDLQENTKSPELKQELALDHTLCPLVKSASTHAGYRTICWSPVGGDRLGRCILATLSHDHRLLLYSTQDTQSTWSLVADLSKLYLENSEWKNTDRTDINYLKTKMYSLSALEMAWTTTCTERNANCSTGTAILSVAMRNGDIVLWLIKFPCQSQEDCKLLKKMTFTSNAPSAVAWSQTPVTMATGTAVDFMAVGYQNGRVDLTSVNLEDGSIVSSLSLHTDEDLLTASCLYMKMISQDQLLVLFAKECFLMAYVVKISDGSLRLLHNSHVMVATTLYITAVCYKEEVLLLSTCDGLLFKGSVSVTNKGVSISLKQWNTDFTRSTENNSGQCYGVDLSDNCMLMCALMSSSRKDFGTFKAKMFKKPMNLHVQPIIHESDELEELKKKVERMIKNETAPLTWMVDVMETFRIHLWQGKDLAPAITNYISNPTSWYTLPLKTLRVLRYFLITINLHIPRNPDSTEPNQEVALAEKNIHKVKDVIIGRYIVDSLEVLQSRRAKMTEKDKCVCSNMLRYMEHHQQKYEDTPLHARLDTLRQSLGKIDTSSQSCCVCGKTAAIGDNYTLSCDEGHTFGLCCQTLQPCTETQYRTCSNCKLQAVSHTDRTGEHCQLTDK